MNHWALLKHRDFISCLLIDFRLGIFPGSAHAALGGAESITNMLTHSFWKIGSGGKTSFPWIFFRLEVYQSFSDLNENKFIILDWNALGQGESQKDLRLLLPQIAGNGKLHKINVPITIMQTRWKKFSPSLVLKINCSPPFWGGKKAIAAIWHTR